MCSDIAIKLENLSKCYQIYEQPHDRLKQSIFPRLRRWLGKTPKQYYREFWALKNVSFELKKGETVGIIGRNGSGKSTLLQLICGTLNPTNGSIQTNGRIAALLELGSGFNPEFTGRENVRMSCTLLGLAPEEIEARFDDITAFADIGQFIDQPIKTYSSGMYVRLAFAVNIVSQPDIMIVDEALAVGDMKFQSKCMMALKRIQLSGTTVLFVSHDMSAVRNLCSRAVYLENGNMQSVGPAVEVAEKYIGVMREEMKEGQIKPAKTLVTYANKSESNADALASHSGDLFTISSEFDARVSLFRSGNGDARITYVQLLDENENEINYVDFDQTVLIRIHFVSHSNVYISPGYYIQDDKKNWVLGASWVGALGLPLIEAKKGDRFIVTFNTRLPLMDGSYSIAFELLTPIILDNLNNDLDIVDNGIVFTVGLRQSAKIWSRVYVPNSADIQAITIQGQENVE